MDFLIVDAITLGQCVHFTSTLHELLNRGTLPKILVISVLIRKCICTFSEFCFKKDKFYFACINRQLICTEALHNIDDFSLHIIRQGLDKSRPWEV